MDLNEDNDKELTKFHVQWILCTALFQKRTHIRIQWDPNVPISLGYAQCCDGWKPVWRDGGIQYLESPKKRKPWPAELIAMLLRDYSGISDAQRSDALHVILKHELEPHIRLSPKPWKYHRQSDKANSSPFVCFQFAITTIPEVCICRPWHQLFRLGRVAMAYNPEILPKWLQSLT